MSESPHSLPENSTSEVKTENRFRLLLVILINLITVSVVLFVIYSSDSLENQTILATVFSLCLFIVIQIALFLYLKIRLLRVTGVPGEIPHSSSTFASQISAAEVAMLSQTIEEAKGQLQATTEELIESRTFFDRVFHSILNGLVVVDVDQSVLKVNQALLNLLGYKEEELLGSSISTIFPHVPEGLFSEETFQTADADALMHNKEAHFIGKNGNLHPVRLSCSFIKNEEGFNQGVVCVVQDLSEIKRMEEEQKNLEEQLRQSQKMEAIGTLAGGIAHDFNNILSTMQGFTWLLLADKPEDSEERDYLNEIHKAGERASSLIQQILTFSRVDSQQLKPLKLSPLIKEALRFIRATIPSSVEIRNDINPDCPPIMANATQIHQILINLCTNALHAMKDSKGVLTISLNAATANERRLIGNEETDQPFLLLTVKDTGHGIPPDLKDRIFEPFFTTKEIGEGTGLGLSVVHGILENHGGKIIVNSSPGKGTEFKIYFPVVEALTEETIEVKENSPLKGKEHILIVEDEPSLARFYEIALKQLGYLTTIESNGHIALSTFKKTPDKFDVVYTDQAMPSLSGVELGKEMLSIKPDLPIILTTGYNMQKLQKDAEAVGIKYFLEKPVNISRLTQLIRDIFDHKIPPYRPLTSTATADSSVTTILVDTEELVQKDRAYSDIIPLFIKERRKEASSVLRAVEEQNYEKIYTLGHKMQGASEAFGLTTVSRIGQALMHSSMKGENDVIRERMLELKDYLDQLEIDSRAFKRGT